MKEYFISPDCDEKMFQKVSMLINIAEGIEKKELLIDAPGGTFVLPQKVADNLIRQAGGNVKKLEILLGLENGSLGNNPVRIDISNPRNLRMPSGNELGANNQWIPGGYTHGGILEAVIDPLMPGEFVVKKILGD